MINQQNIPPDVIAFFQEMATRLQQRSPFFFRVLNAFWGFMTFLAIVLWVAKTAGLFTLIPDPWSGIISSVSLACLFMGNLTVDKKETEDKRTVVADTEVPLPFTEKKAIQQTNSNL